ncbi:MAG: arsenosugar biosynthesis radical SAM (seleno)protein ArsS [Thermodesulfobacteriota bacterium]
MEPFAKTLEAHGIDLNRGETSTLQVNMGLLCNQVCRHCHLSAGPQRSEIMDRETALQVAEYARRGRFSVVDITGGAPELNPNLRSLISAVAPHAQVTLRANLTALAEDQTGLLTFLADHRVRITCSFPALTASQLDSQRGPGVFEKSLSTLRSLNEKGYGGQSLGLDLVVNPAGAFLPSPQAETEKRFRDALGKTHGIAFNNLFCFANVPWGRFRDFLTRSGNLAPYMERLKRAFNPCAVSGVMCRTLVSVSWDGFLYDCDFNLAAGLPWGGRKTHVSTMEAPPAPGSRIATSDLCFTCTAGAGFT